MIYAWFKGLFSKNDDKYDPMKYLVVGLGNMGPKYVGTRHNIGFEVVDYIAESLGGNFKNDNLGDIAEVKHKGRTLVLLKPSTYMNLSGKAVRYWLQKKKIDQDKLIVVMDDLNLEFGRLRLRGKGSDGGHNGLKDINRVLGGNNYARLRFGIGNDFKNKGQVNFVLGEWSKEEMDQLLEHIVKAADACKSFAAIGLKYTMDNFNKKGKA